MRFSVLLSILLLLFSCKEKIEHGYNNSISFNPKDSISVKLQPFDAVKNYSIKLYDINKNVVDEITSDLFMQNRSDTINFWKNGYDYRETFKYGITNKLKSGIYFFENVNPFIVKRKSFSEKKKILVVYPSNTDNAYNQNGGKSSYTSPKGDSLSFNRPFSIQSYSKSFLKWIANQNFEVDYIADIDLDNYENIKGYKTIIIPGHNEYWTRKARRNFDKYIDSGGNAIILSGNTMWWQVRYTKDFSKMICFKNTKKDTFVSDSLKTINWSKKTLRYPVLSSIGAEFIYGGYGNRKDKGWDGFKIIKDSPLFKNTGINLGDTLFIKSAEYDGMPLLNIETTPVIDTSIVKFYKIDLLGYDRAVDGANNDKNGVFIVFKRTKKSGTIINAASTNWCAPEGFKGPSGEKIKLLTYNFIDFLTNDKPVFTEQTN